MTNDKLHDEMIAAMKARDKTRLSIIRQVMGELRNIEVNERREITEADVSDMIKRLIKQTGETLEMSERAGNDDERTARLADQVAILNGLLPRQIAGEELLALIEQTIGALGATSRKDMGRVMSSLAERTGGNLDKAAAAKEVSARLS